MQVVSKSVFQGAEEGDEESEAAREEREAAAAKGRSIFFFLLLIERGMMADMFVYNLLSERVV